MNDETKVEEKDEQAEPTNAAPALKKPVLLGRKLGMLQHFKEDGSVVGATIIVAEANVVTQVRTKERDGYSAIQLGFGRAKKPDRILKGLRMAARQGADKVTVRNLVILRSDPARSLLIIEGAVPGGKNGVVMVRKA